MFKRPDFLMIGKICFLLPLLGCDESNKTQSYSQGNSTGNISTGSHRTFNSLGYDSEGFDRFGFNKEGYDREGFDRLGYDREGFNREGYDWLGYNRLGRDSRGFDRSGRDSEGFDRFGWDSQGFNREGFNFLGRDREGYNKAGYNREGYNRAGYNHEGYNRAGYNREGYNRAGYNREGYNRAGYNREGFDRGGRDLNGFDRAGYNQEGYNRAGYNREGYNRAGYNREGFDRGGRDLNGFDRAGYNQEGYNRAGYNREGFDRGGRDRNGFDRAGYNREGYNREGYNREGYNRAGFDQEGFNRQGINLQGFNRDGFREVFNGGVWVQQRQNQLDLWNFREGWFFAELPQAEEDRIFQEKVDQLQGIRNRDPGRFINIINRNGDRLTDRFLDRLSELILNFRNAWNQMNPNLQQVIQLANSIPGSTAVQNGTIWELKRNALERGLVRNREEFEQLLGAIPVSLAQSLHFLEARTTWFIESLPLVLNREGLSYREISELRVLTENTQFYPRFNDQKDGLIALIDQALARKRAEFPVREVEILDARVRALYGRVRPVIDRGSKFKFYLIRDEAEWADDPAAHGNGGHPNHDCLICVDALDHEHPGVICPMHPHVAYHASADCLIPQIRNQIAEQRFPITCGDLQNPHELPITEQLLRGAGLQEPEIRVWKIHTLRSYYEELIRLQNGRPAQAHPGPNPNPERNRRHCATLDCGALIFPENIRAETQTQVCEVCAFERCQRCGEPPHQGRGCGRVEGDLIFPPDSPFRPCPYCFINTERVDGCNSIQCENPNCGKEWHFNLGKPRRGSFTHDFEPDVDNPRPRLYRVPRDPDYVEGQDMECAFPENQGPIVR